MTRTNYREFKFAVDQFANTVVPERHATLLRAVSLDVLARLVRKSPVDTGRFRNNWYTSTSRPALLTTANTSNNAEARALPSIASIRPFGQLFITNNLPYARRIEDGSSQQAPAGVTRLSVAEAAAAFS